MKDEAKTAIHDIEKVIADVLVDRPKKSNAQILLNAIRSLDLYLSLIHI